MHQQHLSPLEQGQCATELDIHVVPTLAEDSEYFQQQSALRLCTGSSFDRPGTKCPHSDNTLERHHSLFCRPCIHSSPSKKARCDWSCGSSSGAPSSARMAMEVGDVSGMAVYGFSTPPDERISASRCCKIHPAQLSPNNQVLLQANFTAMHIDRMRASHSRIWLGWEGSDLEQAYMALSALGHAEAWRVMRCRTEAATQTLTWVLCRPALHTLPAMEAPTFTACTHCAPAAGHAYTVLDAAVQMDYC